MDEKKYEDLNEEAKKEYENKIENELKQLEDNGILKKYQKKSGEDKPLWGFGGNLNKLVQVVELAKFCI